MDPITAGIASGSGDVAGSIISGLFARKSAKDQMQFQREMSNTAHQREVEDLRKAGLNPILSAGAGASTPSGAGYEVPNIGAGIEKGIASARASKEMNQSIRASEQTIKNGEAIEDKDRNLSSLITKQILTESYNAKTAEAISKREKVMSDWYENNPNLAPFLINVAPVALDALKAGAQVYGAKKLGERNFNIPDQKSRPLKIKGFNNEN